MEFRAARKEDLDGIVNLLSDDELGSQRETTSGQSSETYQHAFEVITSDPNQELIVTEKDGVVIGTFQLTFIQYLTYQGGLRAQIEAVRINRSFRGEGIGEQMFKWAIRRAKERGAHLLQLTSDKQRPDAIRFYEKLGFVASHEGMKLHF